MKIERLDVIPRRIFLAGPNDKDWRQEVSKLITDRGDIVLNATLISRMRSTPEKEDFWVIKAMFLADATFIHFTTEYKSLEFLTLGIQISGAKPLIISCPKELDCRSRIEAACRFYRPSVKGLIHDSLKSAKESLCLYIYNMTMTDIYARRD